MYQRIIIQLYLFLFDMIEYLWKITFGIIENIHIVYFIENNRLNNITLNYYTGFQIKKYSQGEFYVRTIDINGNNYAGFIGNINQINIIPRINMEMIPPKRRTIFFYSNDNILDVDLSKLDNYMVRTQNLDTPINELDKIIKFFRWDCTRIKIITFPLFSVREVVPSEVSINQLYY